MTTELYVPDASCGHCKVTIENAVSGVPGVTRAELELSSKRLHIEHGDSVERSSLKRAVADAGYTADDSQ